MKRILIGLFSVLFILIAAIAIAPSFYDWNQYKETIVKAAKDQAGLDVELKGDIKLALLPAPHAYVSDVVVKSVGDSRYTNVMQLERLDLNLALAPLFSGRADFESIDLVSPAIYIETYVDGSQNWQSEKIKSILEGNEEEKSAGDSNNAMLDKISLSNVEIDNASITLFDNQTKAEKIFKDINMMINADSLSGPFTVQGDMLALGRQVDIDAKTGRFDAEDGSFALKASLHADPENVDVEYAGVIDMQEGLEIQGELRVNASEFRQTLAQYGIERKDILVSSLSSKGLISLADNKFSYKDATVNIDDQKLEGSVEGSVDPLDLQISMRSNNFNLANVMAGTGFPQAAPVSFTGNVKMPGDAIVINNMALKLGETQIAGDFSYEPSRERPLIKTTLNANYLDLNKLMGTQPAASKSDNNIKQTMQSISIPVDAEFDVTIKDGLYGAYKVQGLDAKGSIKNNGLRLNSFNVQNFADMTLSASGNIQNLQSLQGLDLKTSVSTSNLKKAADVLKIDLSALPAEIDKASFAGQFSGSADSLNTTANVKALNGEIILSGLIKDVLGNFAMNNMDVQIKHRSVNEALNIVSPGMGKFDNMNKPLDFYSKVEKSGNDYQLQSIKADIAGIAMSGDAALSLAGKVPDFSGDFQLGDVVVKGNASGSSASGSSSVGWSKDTLSSAWMDMVNFDVKISAKSLDYQGWKMNAPKVDVALNSGFLKLNSLNGGMYNGQVYLTGDAKAANGQNGYSINGDAQLREVSMEPLIQSFAGNRILQGSGLINLDTNISASGLSPSALINALNGKGDISGKDIILEGVDLHRFARALSEESKAGDTILGLWKGSVKGGNTVFDTLDGGYTINNGIVTINELNMKGPKTFLATTGTINLPQFTINTAHEITLQETDVPPFTIRINGPLNNPAQTFGQGVLNDYISRKVNRKVEKVISDKLNDKLGGDLGNALGGMLGLPTKQPQAQTAPNANDVSVDKQQANEAPAAANDNVTTEDTAPQDIQPAANEEPSQEQKPEEALEGLIKGLLQ